MAPARARDLPGAHRERAAASGVPPHHALKTLVLRDAHRRLLLVAVPASERLDLHKVRELLDDKHVELASEQELSRALPRNDVGAVPPVGPGVPHLALLDERVPEYSRIVCSAGDHRHALLIIPAELVAAAAPRIADICED
jgi:prolyl-tRNA editing enzyme YbaK/EbsC (Cys-tRNA(Pro) deacylase)